MVGEGALIRTVIPGLLCLAAALPGCAEPERWEGYAHTDPSDPDFYEYIGTHETIEGCHRMGYAVLTFRGTLDAGGHYECGKNCGWYLSKDRLAKRCEQVRVGPLPAREG